MGIPERPVWKSLASEMRRAIWFAPVLPPAADARESRCGSVL